jgi:hypothetical protein
LDNTDANNVIDCYYVDLTPKSGTNFYANQNEQFRIYFSKQRINLLSATNPNFVRNVGTFYTLPDSGAQLKSKLKALNPDTVFDSIFNRGTSTNNTT